MGDRDLLARLEAHRALGGAPRAELEWLARHGELRTCAAGEVASHKGEPEDWMWVVFRGQLAAYLDRGGEARRVATWRAGDVCGQLPFSRAVTPPGDTVADEACEMLVLHRDHFPALVRECPHVTTLVVHTMVDRARFFTSSQLHDEKLVSLGRLAAGLAHELNNPAAAAAAGIRSLAAGLADADAAAAALAAAGLDGAQLAAIEDARARCRPDPAAARGSPLERADREDAWASWLAANRLDDGAASALAATAATPAVLDALAGALPAHALGPALRSIAAGAALRAIMQDLETSVSRIHELVSAIKGFTHMDRAPAPEPIDLRRGIADTLAVLGAKSRAKAVAMDVTLAPDLPQVVAHGAELNQVWANLIDNALDAVAHAGHVAVSARREGERVIVAIVDDGPGIAAENQGRIFEPFFTTKPVGQGTGLGLDIARRLVERNRGALELDSRPGRTEFRVTLPVAAPSGG